MRDWKQAVVKAFSICLVSFIGMIAGAFILYLISGAAYLLVFGSGPVRNSHECVTGIAVGWLSIFAGAILGALICGYGAYKLVDDTVEDYSGELKPNR